MADLPPMLRNLCERFINDETLSEISQDMGIARGTLYYRLKKLRRALEKTEIEKYF